MDRDRSHVPGRGLSRHRPEHVFKLLNLYKKETLPSEGKSVTLRERKTMNDYVHRCFCEFCGKSVHYPQIGEESVEKAHYFCYWNRVDWDYQNDARTADDDAIFDHCTGEKTVTLNGKIPGSCRK